MPSWVRALDDDYDGVPTGWRKSLRLPLSLGYDDARKLLHLSRIETRPDDNGIDRNGKEKSKVWVVFDKPMAYEVPVQEICDRIHAIGDWIAKEVGEGRTPAMPSGEKARSSLGSLLMRGEDLPGHP